MSNEEETIDKPRGCEASKLNALLIAVVAVLERAAEKHGGPLKLIIDTRGPQYAHTAYGADSYQFSIADIEKMGS